MPLFEQQFILDKKDYEVNLRQVKNHLWNSVGQLLNEIGKLIREHKEITGVNT